MNAVRYQFAAAPRLTFAAAITYTLAWIAGLIVPLTRIDLSSTDAETWTVYKGALGPLVQAGLVHGVAALALAVVTIALAQASFRWDPWASRVILGGGLVAAGLSLLQLVLEIGLFGGIFGVREGNAHRVWQTVTVMDGAKMLALAVMAGALVLTTRRSRLDASGPWFLPRWLQMTAVLAGIALVVSGIGYLFLIDAFLAAAFVSLPLLLVMITASGIVVARRGRA